MKSKAVMAFGIFGLLTLANFEISAQSSRTSRPRDTRRAVRYVILENHIDPSLGADDKERRIVETLMSRESFSKENLIGIYRLVAKRFPNPTLLYLSVSTDLDYVPTPEERDEGGNSGRDSARTDYSGSQQSKKRVKSRVRQAPTAIFIRRTDNTVRLTMRLTGGTYETVEFK